MTGGRAAARAARCTRLRRRLGPIAGCLALLSGGCGLFGARSIAGPRQRYQAAIRETRDEQMLMNLVRMQYDDLPFFLQIASVTSQLSLAVSFGILPHFSPNSVDLNLGASVSETPSITYQLLQGDDFADTLLRDIPQEAVVRLQRGNWDVRDVFKLLAHDLGPMHNLPTKAPTTPERRAQYVKFKDTLELLHWLLDEGVIDFEVQRLPNAVLQSIGGDGGDGASGKDDKGDKGDKDAKDGDSGSTANWPVLRLVKPISDMTAEQRAGWCRLRRQLDARQPESEGPIKDPYGCPLSGKGSCPDDPPLPLQQQPAGCRESAPDTVYYLLPFLTGDKRLGQVGHIAFTTRTLLEVMSAVAGGISIPEGTAHGRPTAGCDASDERVRMMNDLFHVYCSTFPPAARDVAMEVQYRNRWFYIRADDRQTRAVFSILQLLFQWQMRKSIKPLGPTLTLPAGR